MLLEFVDRTCLALQMLLQRFSSVWNRKLEAASGATQGKRGKEAKAAKEVGRNPEAEENHNNLRKPLAVRATKVRAKVLRM